MTRLKQIQANTSQEAFWPVFFKWETVFVVFQAVSRSVFMDLQFMLTGLKISSLFQLEAMMSSAEAQ